MFQKIGIQPDVFGIPLLLIEDVIILPNFLTQIQDQAIYISVETVTK